MMNCYACMLAGNETAVQDRVCVLKHTCAAYYYAKRALELPLPTGVRAHLF